MKFLNEHLQVEHSLSILKQFIVVFHSLAYNMLFMVSFSAQCRLIMFSLCYTNWHINNLFVLLFFWHCQTKKHEKKFTEMSWLTMATSVGNSKYSVRYTWMGSTKGARTHKDVQLDTHMHTHTHTHTHAERERDTRIRKGRKIPRKYLRMIENACGGEFSIAC